MIRLITVTFSCKQYLKDGCHGWYSFIQRLTTFHETHVIQYNISYNPNLWTNGKGDSGQQKSIKLIYCKSSHYFFVYCIKKLFDTFVSISSVHRLYLHIFYRCIFFQKEKRLYHFNSPSHRTVGSINIK
jgi:hypothetical protein